MYTCMYIYLHITFIYMGSFRFNCLQKFEIKNDFYIIWFLTLIPKMYFFFPDFFFIKSYYDLKLFISYAFVKKLEL